MNYIADFHIHSPFSRATSKKSTLAGLYAWANIKGIQIVGTGDFTHPGWFQRIREELTPGEEGFFRLKSEAVPSPLDIDLTRDDPVRFVLSAEISCIYKKQGKTRKIHTVLLVPDLASASKINKKLANIGNIQSDGRPILGLDARNLLEIVLECSPDGMMIPAHVWTPWFSLFGSKSGFDSVEECFEDLSEHIFALETGLSADPAMIRHISALDRYTLVSNSDCHSPSKLGREANLFDTDFSFSGMKKALQSPETGGFKGTVEFFPEEGKYHWDGHRKCDVRVDPRKKRVRTEICPTCGRPLTLGVMHRIMDLADRTEPVYTKHDPGFQSLVSLADILAEITGVGPDSKTVMNRYRKLILKFGSEFNLLLKTSLDDLEKEDSDLLAEAVRRIRNSEVKKTPGFDGQYGSIRIFKTGEIAHS